MIGPVIAATLPLMRAHAESLMTDVCAVARQSSAWSEVEQKTVTTWATIHAAVPCHLEGKPATSRSLLTDEAVTLEAPLVKVAHDVTGIEPDDRVTVTGHDPLWVTSTSLDDATHPVELLIQCRWSR
jgi:hypothetical protein